MSEAFQYERKAIEKGKEALDSFEIVDYRDTLYLVDVEQPYESKYHFITSNNVGNGEENLLDHEPDIDDIDLDVYIYNPEYDDIKEVNDENLIKNILNDEVGI